MKSLTFPYQNIERRLYLVLGFLIVAAWGLLAGWQVSSYASLIGHESLEDQHIAFTWRLAGFQLSWLLMTVAMMFPASLPVLVHLVTPARNGFQKTGQVGFVIGGYLLPWFLFGLLAFLGDSFLHGMADPGAPMASISKWISPGIVLSAGIYQFMPLKRHYMERCQHPNAGMLHQEVKETGGTVLFSQGVRLGAFCVGSCWALMLLIFALGHHHLGWMAALSAVFAAERLAPWGSRLSRLVGAGLIAWSILWVVG